MTSTRPTRQQPHKLASPTRRYMERSILYGSASSGCGIPTTEEVGRALRDGPADADAEEEEVEGRRREAQDFLGGTEGCGTTDVAVAQPEEAEPQE
jgi:hypothetical protein